MSTTLSADALQLLSLVEISIGKLRDELRPLLQMNAEWMLRNSITSGQRVVFLGELVQLETKARAHYHFVSELFKHHAEKLQGSDIPDHFLSMIDDIYTSTHSTLSACQIRLTREYKVDSKNQIGGIDV